MPQQIYCDQCSCRTFYAMLQDDGSVEVFCVTNNHRRVLVNIPELVEHIYKLDGDDYIAQYKDEIDRRSGTKEAPPGNEETLDDSSGFNGPRPATNC